MTLSSNISYYLVDCLPSSHFSLCARDFLPKILYLLDISDLTHGFGQDCVFCFLRWLTYLVFLSLIPRTSCLDCAHLIDTLLGTWINSFKADPWFSSHTLPSYLFLVSVDNLRFLYKTNFCVKLHSQSMEFQIACVHTSLFVCKNLQMLVLLYRLPEPYLGT